VLAWHQTDATWDHKHVCSKPLTVAVHVAECNASSRCLRMCSSNMCISIALCLVCIFLSSFCAHVSVPEVRYVWSTHVGAVYTVNACGSCSRLLYETPCWQSGPIAHSVFMCSHLESCQPGIRSPELTQCLYFALGSLVLLQTLCEKSKGGDIWITSSALHTSEQPETILEAAYKPRSKIRVVRFTSARL